MSIKGTHDPLLVRRPRINLGEISGKNLLKKFVRPRQRFTK